MRRGTAEHARAVARAAAAFRLHGRTAACAELVDVQGNDVLDIGCSFGWFSRYACERRARSVTGIDVDEAALEVARALIPTARFLRASALELPFESESFDVVVAYDVLEHLPSGAEGSLLREMRRVVRRNGRVALSTPHRHWLATYADPALYFGHRHYHVEDVIALVREADLRPESVVLAGGTFDQIDLILYYAWRHLFRREKHPLTSVRRRADREWAEDQGRNTLRLVAVPNTG